MSDDAAPTDAVTIGGDSYQSLTDCPACGDVINVHRLYVRGARPACWTPVSSHHAADGEETIRDIVDEPTRSKDEIIAENRRMEVEE
jgi:hypothetical protein